MRLACVSLLVAVLTPQATLAQDLVSPRARMSKGDTAEEHWDLDARFESGHFVMARFLITNALLRCFVVLKEYIQTIKTLRKRI